MLYVQESGIISLCERFNGGLCNWVVSGALWLSRRTPGLIKAECWGNKLYSNGWRWTFLGELMVRWFETVESGWLKVWGPCYVFEFLFVLRGSAGATLFFNHYCPISCSVFCALPCLFSIKWINVKCGDRRQWIMAIIYHLISWVISWDTKPDNCTSWEAILCYTPVTHSSNYGNGSDVWPTLLLPLC